MILFKSRNCLAVGFTICLLVCCLNLVAQETEVSATASAETDSEIKETSFDEALEQHLESVLSKNLEEYIGSINAEKISMILPNGKLMATIEDIESMHQEWFAETGWVFEYTLIQKSTSEEMAYALLDVDYYTLDEQNLRDYRPFFLVLIFQKDGKHWKLVHDQCTPNISKKIAAESDPAKAASDPLLEERR